MQQKHIIAALVLLLTGAGAGYLLRNIDVKMLTENGKRQGYNLGVAEAYGKILKAYASSNIHHGNLILNGTNLAISDCIFVDYCSHNTNEYMVNAKETCRDVVISNNLVVIPFEK